MANNEIKQKIVLEGEQQYKNAIKDAQRNLKTLRSELKAETAELGSNATAQQKNEAKVKSLQKQIKEQEKIVRANKEALEEVKSKYGDNADAIAKYEQKLNDSRTALANMKNELDGVGQSFKGVENSAAMATVATKSVADSLEKLSGIGDAISGSIEQAFTGMLDTIRGAVTEVWQMIAETAAKANNWTDLASIFGTTATNIEEMQRAVEGMGAGKFDSFVNVMNRLSFGGKEKTITEMLGVSDVNYKDKLSYTMAVIEKLQDFQKTHSRAQTDDLMSEIFGAKKSADVTWILNNWDEILNKRQEYKENGYLMDAGEVETMNDVQLKLFDIEQKWDMLKSKFATGFGQVTLDILTNASGAMDAVARYFNAETDDERNQALADLEKNILDMFETAKKAIEDGIALLDKLAEDLKNSDNPTAQALGNILSGLVDALKWLTEDNMKNVVHALEILAAFWLTGKGASMAAKIASTVANIKLIRGFSGAEKVAEAAGTATAGSGWFATALGGLKSAVGATALPLGVLAAGILPAVIANNYDENRVAEKMAGRLNSAQELSGNNAAFLERAAKALGENWHGGNEAEIEAILMGMGNRSDLQKALLHNMLSGSTTTEGNYTWDELQRLWGGEEMDMGRIRSILEAVADAYMRNGGTADWWQTQGGNSGSTDGMSSNDAKDMTGAMKQLPGEVRKGLSGMKVVMDKTVVGQMVADEVSRQIAGYVV